MLLNPSYTTNGTFDTTPVALATPSCKSGGVQLRLYVALKPSGSYPSFTLPSATPGTVFTTLDVQALFALRDGSGSIILQVDVSWQADIVYGDGGPTSSAGYAETGNAITTTRQPSGSVAVIVSAGLVDHPSRAVFVPGVDYSFGLVGGANILGPFPFTIKGPICQEFVPAGATVTLENLTVTSPLLQLDHYQLQAQTSYRPTAVFTATTDDDTPTLDGTASNDFDGTIAEWEWDYGDGTTSTETSTPTQHAYADDGTYAISLVVKDNDGGLSEPVTHSVVSSAQRIGTCYDAGNMMHSAVKTGADTKFYRFPAGAASRILTATLAGVKPLSMWSDGPALLFGGQEAGTGEFHLWKSLDSGASWSKITMVSIFDPAIFSRAYPMKLHGGGAGAVAVKKETAPAEVYFKQTADETDWSAAAEILAGTLPDGSPKNVHILQGEGIAVIITNGFDWQRRCEGYPASPADWSDY